MPLWRLFHIPAPRGWRRWLEFLPVVIGVLIIFGVISGRFTGGEQEQAKPTSVPVVLAPKFEPLKLGALRVEPMVIHAGDSATLYNGICNETPVDISVTIYMGAQEAGVDPLRAKTIDLIGKDTPEGRQRRTIAPGCIGQEPLVAPLPNTFTPGGWRVILRVVAQGPKGEMQSLTVSTPTFWVVE